MIFHLITVFRSIIVSCPTSPLSRERRAGHDTSLRGDTVVQFMAIMLCTTIVVHDNCLFPEEVLKLAFGA